MNFVLIGLEQHGLLTIGRADFAWWGQWTEAAALTLEQVLDGDGLPRIIHYSGRKPPTPERMSAADVLRFYEDLHYARVPFGDLRRHVRKAFRLTAPHVTAARQWAWVRYVRFRMAASRARRSLLPAWNAPG
jgi:hypothetical protein